ncbi:hypothetical protein [Prauserella cavernicola]|uniref:Uncharacterized protein n=1 Tax=Prauserella cavernicola TaxID=2800127 RepID=A0A934QTN3_9PSEU|nr:hypothetical protein [Prauserella cavernicola]MBK1785144.1 hypothetical protein [Prauserella cavernicola]
MRPDDARQLRDNAAERAVQESDRRRGPWLAFAMLVLCVAGGFGYQQWRVNSTQDAVVHNAAAAAALAAQVRELGARPVVEPPSVEEPAEIVEVPRVDPAAVREAARRAVQNYCADDRCRGADGQAPDLDAIVTDVLALMPAPRDAPPVTDDQVFAQVAALCGQPSEPCRGRTGNTGADGVDGQSPPCLSEPNQCRGADGKPVASWTFVDSLGRTQQCTRDTGSPDTAPTYTCTPEQTEGS